MLRHPRATAVVACSLVALLAFSEPRMATIHPADAAGHEGRHVEVEGVVIDVRAWPGGPTRTTLARDGASLVVQHEGTADRGAWMVARGELRRFGGELRLDADEVSTAAPAGTGEMPLAAVAREPQRYVGMLLVVRGEVQGKVLRDDTWRVATGDGPWRSGPVIAQGALGYDPSCLCYRFHAGAIRPWT